MEWSKTFGGGSAEGGKCIQITQDGGFIIVGSTSSFGDNSWNVWLIKTDANGNKLWDKTFGYRIYNSVCKFFRSLNHSFTFC